MAKQRENSRTLFGGDLEWLDKDWTASDDRVRGGASMSHLECWKHHAIFRGVLNTQTLGGAGFASQRTVDDLHLDLSSYDGIQIVMDAAECDEKKYTFILKDNILPRNPDNGREQSTISWEFDFEVPKASPDQRQENTVELFIPWHHFKATYRGKEKKGVPGLKLSNIRRLSVMMRSFFGSQEGEFQLSLIAIRALNHNRPPNCEGRPEDASSVSVEKTPAGNSAIQRPGVWHWLLGKCGRL